MFQIKSTILSLKTSIVQLITEKLWLNFRRLWIKYVFKRIELGKLSQLSPLEGLLESLLRFQNRQYNCFMQVIACNFQVFKFEYIYIYI